MTARATKKGVSRLIERDERNQVNQRRWDLP